MIYPAKHSGCQLSRRSTGYCVISAHASSSWGTQPKCLHFRAFSNVYSRQVVFKWHNHLRISFVNHLVLLIAQGDPRLTTHPTGSGPWPQVSALTSFREFRTPWDVAHHEQVIPHLIHSDSFTNQLLFEIWSFPMIPSLWLSNGLIPIPATYCFPAEVSKLSRIHIWEPPGCCKGRCFCSFNPTPSTGISFPTEKDALAIFGWCFGTKSGTHLNTLHSFHVLCQGIHLTCFFEFLFFSPYIDCICMYV